METKKYAVKKRLTIAKVIANWYSGQIEKVPLIIWLNANIVDSKNTEVRIAFSRIRLFFSFIMEW